MKDTHGENPLRGDARNCLVLILIVMKDTHGEKQNVENANVVVSLNPYCNERYSWSLWQCLYKTMDQQRLNPYCNERYSWRFAKL